jgi:hypothetical protein
MKNYTIIFCKKWICAKKGEEVESVTKTNLFAPPGKMKTDFICLKIINIAMHNKNSFTTF